MASPNTQKKVVRLFSELVETMASESTLNPFGGTDEMGADQADLFAKLQDAGMNLEQARQRASEAILAIENDDMFAIAGIFRTIMKNLNLGTVLKFM